MIDPPDYARKAAGQCRQQRCWPVLAGEPGGLGGPRFADHPVRLSRDRRREHRVLFDATEIDEILMLRVLTMTDAEKGRSADPKAAEIIERCDAMSAEDLLRLHGTLRDPGPLPSWNDADDPFAAFNDHDPDTSEVVISARRSARKPGQG